MAAAQQRTYRVTLDLTNLAFESALMPDELLAPGGLAPFLTASVNDDPNSRSCQKSVIRGVDLFAPRGVQLPTSDALTLSVDGADRIFIELWDNNALTSDALVGKAELPVGELLSRVEAAVSGGTQQQQQQWQGVASIQHPPKLAPGYGTMGAQVDALQQQQQLVWAAPIAFHIVPVNRYADKYRRASLQCTTTGGAMTGGGTVVAPGGVVSAASWPACQGGIARVQGTVSLYDTRAGCYARLSIVEQAGLAAHLGPAGQFALPAVLMASGQQQQLRGGVPLVSQAGFAGGQQQAPLYKQPAVVQQSSTVPAGQPQQQQQPAGTTGARIFM